MFKKIKKILIVLVIFFFLGGIYTAYQIISHLPPKQKGPPQEKRPWQQGKEIYQPININQVPESPKEKVIVYKGFWLPCSFLNDQCQPMNEPTLIKETGANIIGLAPNIKINSKGEVGFFPLDFVERRIFDYAQKYYPLGIRIFISPELDFTEDLNSNSQSVPRSIPREAAVKPGFLDKYDLIIEDLAKLAEKYHLEMFSAMNEPDMKLSTDVSSKWGQAILPKIKKYYTGKVLWKVGQASKISENINFKGYDVIGVDFTVPGGPENLSLYSYPSIVETIITEIKDWAKRDNVAQVLFSEFGVWDEAIKFSEEGKVKAHQIVFENGKGQVDGFIVLDTPPDLGDRPLKGSKTLEEIKFWFREKL